MKIITLKIAVSDEDWDKLGTFKPLGHTETNIFSGTGKLIASDITHEIPEDLTDIIHVSEPKGKTEK